MRKNVSLVFLTCVFLFTLFQLNTFAEDTARWSLPEGAKARFGKGSIKQIAYSPNGMYLAAAGSIGIWIYDMTTYREVALLTEYTGPISSISFSPDGRTIVSGSDDGSVRLWDVFSGKHIQTFTRNANRVLSVCFSPDGKMLASGGDDTSEEGPGFGIHLRDAHTGELLKVLEGNNYGTLSVCFSPDGKTLASGGDRSSDNILLLWNVDTGEPIEVFRSHEPFGSFTSVTFSPDGNIIACASNDQTIRFWSPQTGLLLKTIIGHTESVNGVIFSPDGKLFISAAADGIRVWDANTNELIEVLLVPALNVVFSPDGKTFVSGSSDGIHVWDTHNFELLKTMARDIVPIESVVFSPDGKTIAGAKENNLYLWDVHANKYLKAFRGHTDSVRSVVFSPDGKTIASGSEDKTIRLWNTHAGELIKTLIAHTASVRSVVFSPDGKTIASGSEDKTIRLWNTHAGELIKTLTEHMENVNTIAFSPDGNTIASGSGSLVPVNDISNNPDSVGEEIRLWDAHTGKLLQTLMGHTSIVNSVTFSPDGSTIASVSGHWQSYKSVWSVGEEICLWSAQTGELLKTLTGHKDVVSSVVFSPDGSYIVSGDWYHSLYDTSGGAWSGEIRVWHAQTGELLKTLTGHTGGVSSLAFSPDGKTIANGRTDGTILLWDFSTPP